MQYRTQILPCHVRDARKGIIIGEARIADILSRANYACLEELVATSAECMRAHWGASDEDIADLAAYVRAHPGCPDGFVTFRP